MNKELQPTVSVVDVVGVVVGVVDVVVDVVGVVVWL